MKKLAWLLVPLLCIFAAAFLADAEWQSITAPRYAPYIARAAPAKPAATPVHILFTGDVMLDRTVALHAARVGDDALVAGIRPLLVSADAVVVNLEGTITDNSSVSIPDHSDLRFTFAPSFAPWLASIGVRAVSLSNNHADDFGASGYSTTKAYLDAAGIAHFGSPANAGDASAELTLGGRRVCFVGYEGFIATDPAPLVADITALRPDCDYLVATMHAGTEYATTSTPLQQAAAHAFIDAGADAVIGTHPHVIEPIELYRGKPIFYSLGNFIFDQDFSWNTEHGLTVEAAIGATSTTYTLIPVTVQGGEVSTTTDAASIGRALLAAFPGTDAQNITMPPSFIVPR